MSVTRFNNCINVRVANLDLGDINMEANNLRNMAFVVMAVVAIVLTIVVKG